MPCDQRLTFGEFGIRNQPFPVSRRPMLTPEHDAGCTAGALVLRLRALHPPARNRSNTLSPG